MDLDILYEDEDVILINKPKGMVVHPAPGHSGGTLVNAVMYHCRGKLSGINGVTRPGIVHRIDTLRMAEDLQSIPRDSVDAVIACMHWGNEYERRPDAAQRRLAGFLQRHGVDIIASSHPHVIQPFEADSSRVVLYSLGNFVSNQQKRYCDGGLVARIEIVKRDTLPVRFATTVIPVWVYRPDYRILPPEVADTLPLPAEARRRYEEFMEDTRRLIGRFDR